MAEKLVYKLSNFPEQGPVELNQHVSYLMLKYQAAAKRQGTASTKTRSEVSGGGAKPYKQKGTGNARRGTNRTPLRPGGAIVFGPKPRSYAHSLNHKLVKAGIANVMAFFASKISVLSYEQGVALNTRNFAPLFAEAGKVYVILQSEDLYVALRNFNKIRIGTPNAIDLAWLIDADKVYIEESAVPVLVERFGG